MTIREQDLESYKSIHKETYWTELSEEDALRQAQALINLIRYSTSPKTFDYGD